jgi:hypothetical protein
MTYSPVTVCVLIYRSPAWLSFVLEGLAWARNRTPYRVMIVGNDAEPQVMETGRVDVDFRNIDPSEYYLNRVYRAWNAAVEAAETEMVILLNSDMYVSDYWLDALVDEKLRDPMTLPCSLLVESGRIHSAMPEYVKDFWTTPDTFRSDEWTAHAASIRQPGKTESGRLFMPVLVNKDEFKRVGGYPIGNVVRPKDHQTVPGGKIVIISGDKDLFSRYEAIGFKWVTCLGSVVYHAQEGEMRGE